MAKISAEDIKRVKGLGFLKNRGTEDCFSARVITENGVLTTKEIACVAEAAEKYGNGKLSFTSRLTIEVPGIRYDNIEAFCSYIAKENLVTGGTGPKVRPIVACKGTVCGFGNSDTQGIATKIHKEFYENYHNVTLPHKFKIAIGGCPNNCVKPDINDLGIISVNVPQYEKDDCRSCKKCAIEALCPMKAAKLQDGGKMEIDTSVCNTCGRCVGKCPFGAIPAGTKGFRVYLGGRWGKETQRGLPLQNVYNEEELFCVIEKAILLYKEQGIPGERFGSMVNRLGMAFFEEEMASDRVLQQKNQILGIDPKDGAVC